MRSRCWPTGSSLGRPLTESTLLSSYNAPSVRAFTPSVVARLGYASELSRAWRTYAFEQLGTDHLVSVIHPDNAASIQIAIAIGHVFEHKVVLDGIRVSIYGQYRTHG
jgi:Acetyltransferase (GNAT) domain